MKYPNLLKYSLLIVVSLLLYNCSKTEDVPADLQINDFVWKGLNAYYYWQNEMPDLSDTRFSSQNQINSFISNYDTPDNLFYSLLNNYPITDKYSFIVDDYVSLENSLNGINLSTGMEFGLVRYASNPTDLFGYVRYVLPGSDADLNGIVRGMLFNLVDGVQLTESNFRGLLFSNTTSFTISLANYNGGNPIATGTTVSLMKTDIEENPIKIVKTFTEGANKIGYLMYNQFVSSYDGDLNTAFSTLQSEGITDLVIDLRYNSGGSVRTATYLGSMITGQYTGQLFSREIWNTKVLANLDESNFINNFTTQINNGFISQNINSLNLNTVYFIVTGATASASELLINSLNPYIDVKLVGTQTEGKNVGSVTLYDSTNYGRAGANPNHTWALQPIVLEIRNNNNFSSVDGFTPEIALGESYDNLGVLGDRNEPLLDRAISYIVTGARSSNQQIAPIMEEISNSKLFTPTSNNMYVELKK
ncbi:MAG: peptidase S41 [Flavobacteriaceae bacterium]